jgi:hypothetical protein
MVSEQVPFVFPDFFLKSLGAAIQKNRKEHRYRHSLRYQGAGSLERPWRNMRDTDGARPFGLQKADRQPVRWLVN